LIATINIRFVIVYKIPIILGFRTFKPLILRAAYKSNFKIIAKSGSFVSVSY